MITTTRIPTIFGCTEINEKENKNEKQLMNFVYFLAIQLLLLGVYGNIVSRVHLRTNTTIIDYVVDVNEFTLSHAVQIEEK